MKGLLEAGKGKRIDEGAAKGDVHSFSVRTALFLRASEVELNI